MPRPARDRPGGQDRIGRQFRYDHLGNVREFLEAPFPEHVYGMPAGTPRRAREGPELQVIVPGPGPGPGARAAAMRHELMRVHGSVLNRSLISVNEFRKCFDKGFPDQWPDHGRGEFESFDIAESFDGRRSGAVSLRFSPTAIHARNRAA